MIDERCGLPKDIDNASEGKLPPFPHAHLIRLNENSPKLLLIVYFTKEKLKAICAEYHKRAVGLESIKYDLEHEVVIKDYEVNQELKRQSNLKLKGILECREIEKNGDQFKNSFEAFPDWIQ